MISPRDDGSGLPSTARPSPPAAHSPCVVDLLSDSDTAPSPNPRDAAAYGPTAGPATAQEQPAAAPNHITADHAATRRSSIDQALANMVDLLSDDDADDALGGKVCDGGAAVEGAGPTAGPLPHRSTSARRIRKPARFADADDVEPASPQAMRGSAEHTGRGPDDGGSGGGAYQWPSPPEDSFFDDGPAESLPMSACDFHDPSPPPKRCALQHKRRSILCRIPQSFSTLMSCLGFVGPELCQDARRRCTVTTLSSV